MHSHSLRLPHHHLRVLVQRLVRTYWVVPGFRLCTLRSAVFLWIQQRAAAPCLWSTSMAIQVRSWSQIVWHSATVLATTGWPPGDVISVRVSNWGTHAVTIETGEISRKGIIIVSPRMNTCNNTWIYVWLHLYNT